MMLRAVLVVAVLVLAACGSSGSGAEQPTSTAEPGREASGSGSRGVRLVRVGNFDTPVYATGAPGDRRRVYVVEQGGRVVVVRGGRKLDRPYLDIRSLVLAGGEQGLLSVAFPPDHQESGLLYVYYTARNGNQRIVEYRRASADRANAGSARIVLEMADDESNHNGGLMLFGPDDLMYVGTGDGGGAGDRHGRRGNGQNLGTLLGKLLRIDPRRGGDRPYRIPSSNPFVDRSGARAEIYAYGLRNPWRFSFDRRTGDLSIGDVGQNEIEEINFVRRGRGRGANFGWRPFEGTRRFAEGEEAPGHVKPVLERSHDDGWCSITGGVVVRDPDLPGLAGRYVFGDYCRQRIVSARLAVPRARDVRTTSLRVEGLVSFGEDARGRVYAVSNNGPVYRLAAR